VDPATNCVDNTSKALQKLKCFKSSETRSNMPITRLEMAGFTFRFNVKRCRNAGGTERDKERMKDEGRATGAGTLVQKVMSGER